MCISVDVVGASVGGCGLYLYVRISELASFPGSPNTRTKLVSDEKLGGAWEQGYQ